jgi:hypothetical protein
MLWATLILALRKSTPRCCTRSSHVHWKANLTSRASFPRTRTSLLFEFDNHFLTCPDLMDLQPPFFKARDKPPADEQRMQLLPVVTRLPITTPRARWLPRQKASLSHRQQNRAMPLRPSTALCLILPKQKPSSGESFLEAADKVGRPRSG